MHFLPICLLFRHTLYNELHLPMSYSLEIFLTFASTPDQKDGQTRLNPTLFFNERMRVHALNRVNKKSTPDIHTQKEMYLTM